MSEWISVNDRLPPESWEAILIYGSAACTTCSKLPKAREGRYCQSGSYIGFEFGEYDCPCDVTHWMPLPEPPK